LVSKVRTITASIRHPRSCAAFPIAARPTDLQADARRERRRHLPTVSGSIPKRTATTLLVRLQHSQDDPRPHRQALRRASAQGQRGHPAPAEQSVEPRSILPKMRRVRNLRVDLESVELQIRQQAIAWAPGVISLLANCLKPLTPFAGENCSCSTLHSESQIRRSCDPS
jgi:hypothetical protein